MDEDWENQPEGEDDDQQQQLQQQDLDEDDDEEEEDILDTGEEFRWTNDKESLLMRFCPHDSSMLYPGVRANSKSESLLCTLKISYCIVRPR
jgi:hypothetical protein